MISSQRAVKALGLSILSVSFMASSTLAHPDEDNRLNELRDKSEALAERARTSGEEFINGEMMASMADLLSEFADKVDVEKGDETGTALWFDGNELFRFKMDRDRAVEDALTITGLGRNLSVERETIIRDGKTRTRIIIEMDGGDAATVKLPTDLPTEVPSDQE